MRRLLCITAVWLGALCAGPAVVLAHPLLVTAAPTPGLVAPSAPEAVELQFSEPTVPRGTSVTVLTARGAAVATEPMRAGNVARTLTLAPAAKLRAGIYRVRWRALGAD